MLSCGHSKLIDCVWKFSDFPIFSIKHDFFQLPHFFLRKFLDIPIISTINIFFSFHHVFVELFGFSDIFHNQHDLFRTRDDDLSGGLKTVPRSYFGFDTTCQNSKRQEGNYSFQNEKKQIGTFGSAQQIYPQGLESKLQCQVTSVF